MRSMWARNACRIKSYFTNSDNHLAVSDQTILKCSNVRPLLSITFPQGFRISKNIGHPTSGSGNKKTVKRYLKSEQTDRRTDGQTDRRTDGQMDRRTFRLIESIGPEGRCFENTVFQSQQTQVWKSTDKGCKNKIQQKRAISQNRQFQSIWKAQTGITQIFCYKANHNKNNYWFKSYGYVRWGIANWVTTGKVCNQWV